MDSEKYNKDYYENGLQSGVSAYENYRWIPELTIPLAHTIALELGIKTTDQILDFGCAKGYLVKAFHLLHYNVFGLDISRYAIDNAPGDIQYCLTYWNRGIPLRDVPMIVDRYDWVIAKDVFEHIEQQELINILNALRYMANRMFVIVPLGKKGKYYAPTNNLDRTHQICQPLQWWDDMFKSCRWHVDERSSYICNMKQSYRNIKNAHGFFKLSIT